VVARSRTSLGMAVHSCHARFVVATGRCNFQEGGCVSTQDKGDSNFVEGSLSSEFRYLQRVFLD
jgi:hypothetical protein